LASGMPNASLSLTSIKDKLDVRRALDQCPYQDPNLLCETATSEGDHGVEGADRSDGF